MPRLKKIYPADLFCRLQFCNTAVEFTQTIWISVGISVLTLQFLVFQVQCVDSYHYPKQTEHLLNLFYRLKRRKGSNFKLYMEPMYKNIRRFTEHVTVGTNQGYRDICSWFQHCDKCHVHRDSEHRSQSAEHM